MSPDLKAYIKAIARFYKVKLRFTSGSCGLYWKGAISLGKDATDKHIIDTFFHELAHFKNDLEGLYPVYHKVDARKAIRRMGIKRYAKYALEAELVTESVGKELCKIWMPKHKYRKSYQRTAYWHGFMYGYYLPEAGK